MADQMTRLVVDSPSLFYRAFFALPKSIKGPDGNSVNAVRGYLDMVSRVLVDRRPRAVAHVFDADWRPQWRVDLYAGYKSTRADDPPELPGQVPLLLEVLDAAGLPVAEAAGYEADDVIGTIAAAAGPDERLAVLTGDRDLFQVVRDPVVWVLYPLKGTSSLATMDAAGVAAKTKVPAERYVDLAILRGDPSDGLPGVPGIGEKTAATLVADHPDLDALLAAAAQGRLTPRLNAALTDSADYVQAMRKVAAVATDVDYRISDPHPPDRERLAALATANAIEGPVERRTVTIPWLARSPTSTLVTPRGRSTRAASSATERVSRQARAIVRCSRLSQGGGLAAEVAPIRSSMARSGPDGSVRPSVMAYGRRNGPGSAS